MQFSGGGLIEIVGPSLVFTMISHLNLIEANILLSQESLKMLQIDLLFDVLQ